MEHASVGLYVREYDGPISAVANVTDGWSDTVHAAVKEPWESGEVKQFTLRVRARNLARAGTYIARIEITRFTQQSSPNQEEEHMLSELEGQVGEDMVAVLRAFVTPQPGVYRGELAGTTTLVELFRVEELSSVLNFWLLLGTLILAAATLVLAVIALTG